MSDLETAHLADQGVNFEEHCGALQWSHKEQERPAAFVLLLPLKVMKAPASANMTIAGREKVGHPSWQSQR